MIKVIIFCAAGIGKRVNDFLDEREYEILAFADNSKEWQGKEYFGKKVIAPKEITDYNFDYIIIANGRYEKVLTEQLNEMKIDNNKIMTFLPNYKGIIWKDSRWAMIKNCVHQIKERKIKGNIAELGVYRGDTASYLNYMLPTKKIYLFDTFEGFSDKDTCVKQELSGLFKETSIDIVLNKMTTPDNAIIKKGWFPETTNNIEDTFCFVSIDPDLYEPTYEGLKYFYPRLENGGYIFVHDFGVTNTWPGVHEAVEQFCKENQISYVPVLDEAMSVIITK